MNKETLKITLAVLILVLIASIGVYGYVNRNEILDKFQSVGKKQPAPVEKIERQTITANIPPGEHKNELEPVKLDKPVNQILTVDEKKSNINEKKDEPKHMVRDVLPPESKELKVKKLKEKKDLDHPNKSKIHTDSKTFDKKNEKAELTKTNSKKSLKEKKRHSVQSKKKLKGNSKILRQKKLEKRIAFLEKKLRSKKKLKPSLAKLEKRVMKLEKLYLKSKKAKR